MIDTHALKVKIVDENLTQKDVAQQLGITPKTFYKKMKKGIFNSNEIEQLIVILRIPDPMSIFFAQKVT